jgi:hypothetical protein
MFCQALNKITVCPDSGDRQSTIDRPEIGSQIAASVSRALSASCILRRSRHQAGGAKEVIRTTGEGADM